MKTYLILIHKSECQELKNTEVFGKYPYLLLHSYFKANSLEEAHEKFYAENRDTIKQLKEEEFVEFTVLEISRHRTFKLRNRRKKCTR